MSQSWFVPPQDLRLLHQRIGELESALREPAHRAPRSPWRAMRYLLVTILFVGIGAVAARAALPRREIVSRPLPLDPETLPPNALELTDTVGPSLVDVDGDGVRDLVVRGLRPRVDGPAMHVGLLDGKTYEVRWRAGPFAAGGRGQGHLLATKHYVVVTEGADRLRILEARTGQERASLKLAPIKQLHSIPGEEDRILITFAGPDPEHRGPTQQLDLLTERVSTELSEPALCVADGSRSCGGEVRGPSPARRTERAYEIRDGSDTLTVVEATAGVGPGAIEHGMLLVDGKPKWRTPLVPPTRRWTPWPNTAPTGFTDLAKGRVYHVYPLPDASGGGHRLAIRALATGKLVHDLELPGLGYGSVIHSLTAEQDRAFVFANETLLVIDGASGAVLRRISRF